jgi:hypothetical protein
MQRTAAPRFLILALILGAVLSLPGGLLAAAGAASPGCAHCQDKGPGLASGCCCCQPGTPGNCGSSSQDASFNCRCASGGPACFAPAATAAPLYPTSPYLVILVPISTQLFPPDIFHPPESQPCST